ncbi:hypothetical protein [Variovorax terrae]|uniref:Uncharacterized protein n=1 Tax=Variovorax terrae TaxID=2923278 RepID=A0A9X2AMM9_9BURK|nr:hypothetical protein [Variovorax terrae]MCJ0763534.1 hypothetical protein [Variovorax terrae]
MPEFILVGFVVLVCGPLSVVALSPFWSFVVLMLGERQEVNLQSVEISGLTHPTKSRDLERVGIYRVRTRLGSGGHDAGYEVVRALSASQIKKLLVLQGNFLTIHCFPVLTRRFGFNRFTARIDSGLLRPGVLIVLPFWLLGVLPLASVLFSTLTEKNIFFEFLRFLSN